LARHPALAEAMAAWGRYYLSSESDITARLRELVIDRTTALCGADYEWGVHIAYFADKVGLTRAQIQSLAVGIPADSCWVDPIERTVLTSVDELHATHDLCDSTWARLVEATGEQVALEIV
jgi:alkylhydroperoxidase family enzyme